MLGEKCQCNVGVGGAVRHGEFTTHQPSPPDCPEVTCVGVKKEKNTVKKNPLPQNVGP